MAAWSTLRCRLRREHTELGAGTVCKERDWDTWPRHAGVPSGKPQLNRLGQGQQEEFLNLHGQYSWTRKMCLSGAEDLVTVDAGGNEGLCLFCITVHQEGLQAPELRDGAQGGGDPPVLEGN